MTKPSSCIERTGVPSCPEFTSKRRYVSVLTKLNENTVGRMEHGEDCTEAGSLLMTIRLTYGRRHRHIMVRLLVLLAIFRCTCTLQGKVFDYGASHTGGGLPGSLLDHLEKYNIFL